MKKLSLPLPEQNDTIHVAIRVRPLNERELSSGQQDAWAVSGNSISQTTPASSSSVYSFGLYSFCTNSPF